MRRPNLAVQPRVAEETSCCTQRPLRRMGGSHDITHAVLPDPVRDALIVALGVGGDLLSAVEPGREETSEGLFRGLR